MTLILACLGVVLTTAALLKLAQSAAPIREGRPLEAAFLLAILEGVFGGWLILGRTWRRVTWFAAIGLFSIFGVASLVAISRGEASCGCFGDVRLPPWFALAIDLLAVCALLSSARRSSIFQNLGAVVATGASFAFLATVSTSMAIGYTTGDEMREVDSWIGKPLSLLSRIEPTDGSPVRFDDDELTVLAFYRPGCPSCVRMLADLGASGEVVVGAPFDAPIVLVQISKRREPPPLIASASVRHCHLRASEAASIPTPMILRLRGGIVTSVHRPS